VGAGIFSTNDDVPRINDAAGSGSRHISDADQRVGLVIAILKTQIVVEDATN